MPMGPPNGYLYMNERPTFRRGGGLVSQFSALEVDHLGGCHGCLGGAGNQLAQTFDSGALLLCQFGAGIDVGHAGAGVIEKCRNHRVRRAGDVGLVSAELAVELARCVVRCSMIMRCRVGFGCGIRTYIRAW